MCPEQIRQAIVSTFVAVAWPWASAFAGGLDCCETTSGCDCRGRACCFDDGSCRDASCRHCRHHGRDRRPDDDNCCQRWWKRMEPPRGAVVSSIPALMAPTTAVPTAPYAVPATQVAPVVPYSAPTVPVTVAAPYAAPAAPCQTPCPGGQASHALEQLRMLTALAELAESRSAVAGTAGSSASSSSTLSGAPDNDAELRELERRLDRILERLGTASP